MLWLVERKDIQKKEITSGSTKRGIIYMCAYTEYVLVSEVVMIEAKESISVW